MTQQTEASTYPGAWVERITFYSSPGSQTWEMRLDGVKVGRIDRAERTRKIVNGWQAWLDTPAGWSEKYGATSTSREAIVESLIRRPDRVALAVAQIAARPAREETGIRFGPVYPTGPERYRGERCDIILDDREVVGFCIRADTDEAEWSAVIIEPDGYTFLAASECRWLESAQDRVLDTYAALQGEIAHANSIEAAKETEK